MSRKGDKGDKGGRGESVGLSEEERRAAETAGMLYRFREAGDGQRLTPSTVLDILQSLHFACRAHPERIARLATWSESRSEGTGRSLVAALAAALDRPNGLLPILWETDYIVAGAANTRTFTGHPPDDVFKTRSGRPPEIWLPVEPGLMPVDAMGFEAIEARADLSDERKADERFRVHNEWWELPYPCLPLGLLMLPSTTPVALTTWKGQRVAAWSSGMMAVAVFAPVAEERSHQALPLIASSTPGVDGPEGLAGPTWVLRPLEMCWDGPPAQPFYGPLLAMRWFMNQPFTETKNTPAPVEKEREVRAVSERQGLPAVIPLIRSVAFQQRANRPGTPPPPRTEEQEAAQSGGERFRGWWGVTGHVRWVKGAGGVPKRTWVTDYEKNRKAKAEGKPYIGKKAVGHVSRGAWPAGPAGPTGPTDTPAPETKEREGGEP